VVCADCGSIECRAHLCLILDRIETSRKILSASVELLRAAPSIRLIATSLLVTLSFALTTDPYAPLPIGSSTSYLDDISHLSFPTLQMPSPRLLTWLWLADRTPPSFFFQKKKFIFSPCCPPPTASPPNMSGD
jgi:hypothetical protein